MLGYDEKVFLSVSDVYNKNGEKYLITMSLPQNFEFIGFPDDVVKVSVYETEQKKHNKKYNAFNILVGNVSTLEKLYEDEEEVGLSVLLEDAECIQPDDLIVFFRDEDDECVVFSKINDGDIVVESVGELEEKIMDISHDFERIQRGINNIKKYVYKK